MPEICTIMKEIRCYSIFLFACLLILTGCGKTKEIEFDAELEGELFIDIPPQDRGVEFFEYTDIEPRSDPEVNKYINRIKNVEVEGLYVEFVDITKEINLQHAYFSLYDNDTTSDWEFEDIFITEGIILALGNTEGQYDVVKHIVNTKESYYVSIWGESDQGDVSFTIKVQNKFRYTADAL